MPVPSISFTFDVRYNLSGSELRMFFEYWRDDAQFCSGLLFRDIDTAIKVGERHGRPAVFKVFAGNMFRSGQFTFYLSNNGIWLTGIVPSCFLQLVFNGK